MPASVVIGQPDFVSSTGGVTQNKFNSLSNGWDSVFVDPNGRLILGDTNNHRVLIWNSVPVNSGLTNADLVLGQPDFTSSTSNNGGLSARTLSFPDSVWSDGSRLLVDDNNNSRVLIWNTF